MMSKYKNLTFHLAGLNESEWTASFEQVEGILGFPLPDSAHQYNAWWANQSGSGHSQSSAWQSAGWKTRDLDLQSKKVTFYNDGGRGSAVPLKNDKSDPDDEPLTIAQAKAGLAANFGVSEDAIEIHIRG